MATPELGLLDLSNEILFEIFIRVPYDQLQKTCNTCSQTKQICADWNFWNRKAQFDFGISAQEFNTTSEPDGRTRYLQIKRDVSEFRIFSSFFKDMFHLGLYLRGWRGPSRPYPLRIETFNPWTDSGIFDSLIKVTETLNGNTNLKSLLMMEYFNDEFFAEDCTIHEFHSKFIGMIRRSHLSLQPFGEQYIITALYYLRRRYGITLLNFDFKRFINER